MTLEGQGAPLIPPLTGVIEDLGLIGDSGRVILILKLETPVTDEQLLPARMGKRSTVMVAEEPEEPDDMPVDDGPTPDELREMAEESKQPPVYDGPEGE